jgi:hypothetical protein
MTTRKVPIISQTWTIHSDEATTIALATFGSDHVKYGGGFWLPALLKSGEFRFRPGFLYWSK